MNDNLEDIVPEHAIHYVSELRKEYDLEERTFRFAKDVRDLVKKVKITIINIEYIKQLVRASGSVGSNYIEANDSLGNKDFLMHIRISKKEAKESIYWLRLLDTDCNEEINNCKEGLLIEARELMNIFGKILSKFK